MYKGRPLTLYVGNNCPFCVYAKNLLNKNQIRFDEHLMETPEARAQLARMAQGRTSIPQIFWGDEHIGGYDDLCIWLKKSV